MMLNSPGITCRLAHGALLRQNVVRIRIVKNLAWCTGIMEDGLKFIDTLYFYIY